MNDLDLRQKIVARYFAKKQDNNEAISTLNFTDSSKEPIASCSKWLSAVLVMTFVDEGKLNLEDSIGKYLPVMSNYGKGGIKIKYCLSHLTGIHLQELKVGAMVMENG